MALTNSFMKLSAVISMLIVIAASCKTQGWEFSANKYDLRTAQIKADGQAGGRTIHTMLSLECRPGPEGTVGICYFVYGADNAGSFDFNSFEGPYAPASSRNLFDIDVVTANGTINIKTKAAGSYIEHDAFMFGIYAMNTGNSDVKRAAEALMKGATNIIVTVHDMKNPATQLTTNFPALNASPVIEKTMKGCCTE